MHIYPKLAIKLSRTEKKQNCFYVCLTLTARIREQVKLGLAGLALGQMLNNYGRMNIVCHGTVLASYALNLSCE